MTKSLEHRKGLPHWFACLFWLVLGANLLSLTVVHWSDLQSPGTMEYYRQLARLNLINLIVFLGIAKLNKWKNKPLLLSVSLVFIGIQFLIGLASRNILLTLVGVCLLGILGLLYLNFKIAQHMEQKEKAEQCQ